MWSVDPCLFFNLQVAFRAKRDQVLQVIVSRILIDMMNLKLFPGIPGPAAVSSAACAVVIKQRSNVAGKDRPFLMVSRIVGH